MSKKSIWDVDDEPVSQPSIQSSPPAVIGEVKAELPVPRASKAPSDAALKFACKQVITGYRTARQNPKFAGAPWWDLYTELEAFSRKKGWPVDAWLEPRSKKRQ